MTDHPFAGNAGGDSGAEDDDQRKNTPHGEHGEIVLSLPISLADAVQAFLADLVARDDADDRDHARRNGNEAVALTPHQRRDLRDVYRQLAALAQLSTSRRTGIGVNAWPGPRILLRLRPRSARVLTEVLAQARSAADASQNTHRMPHVPLPPAQHPHALYRLPSRSGQSHVIPTRSEAGVANDTAAFDLSMRLEIVLEILTFMLAPGTRQTLAACLDEIAALAPPMASLAEHARAPRVTVGDLRTWLALAPIGADRATLPAALQWLVPLQEIISEEVTDPMRPIAELIYQDAHGKRRYLLFCSNRVYT